MFDVCGRLVSVLYGCRSYYRIHFHVDTKIYSQYSVDRLKKEKKQSELLTTEQSFVENEPILVPTIVILPVLFSIFSMSFK